MIFNELRKKIGYNIAIDVPFYKVTGLACDCALMPRSLANSG